MSRQTFGSNVGKYLGSSDKKTLLTTSSMVSVKLPSLSAHLMGRYRYSLKFRENGDIYVWFVTCDTNSIWPSCLCGRRIHLFLVTIKSLSTRPNSFVENF